MLAWQASSGKRRGGGDNAERMPSLPRWGLFLLSRATDEPQMDGQLLWVSEPREVGVARGETSVCVSRSWYAGQGGTSA